MYIIPAPRIRTNGRPHAGSNEELCYGSHVGRRAVTWVSEWHEALQKIAQRIANKWPPDKRVRDEESSWRYNGAAARSVLSNYHVLDDFMEVGLRLKRQPALCQ